MALSLKSGLSLYIARHGETEANVAGRFQGQTINTPLTHKGIQQVHGIAQIMRRESDLAILAHVSSPLARACTTMEIVLSDNGLPGDDYTTDARIIEIDLGAWDGLTKAEARALDPAAYDAREADKWNVKSLDGRENYSAVARRAESWISDLSKDTFAISHGAFTRVLRGLFQGLTWKQMSDLDEPQGCVFLVQGNDVKRLDL